MKSSGALKLLRVELGMSQTELAGKLNVSPGTIVRWEKNYSFPKKHTEDRILQLLEQVDITKLCENQIRQWLSRGRRQGVSADKYGYANVDQDLLCEIVDDSSSAVYAIEAGTYNILYANRQSEKIAPFDSKNVEGKSCYNAMRGRSKPCDDCPLKNIQSYEFSEQIIEDANGEHYRRIRGHKKKWNGKDIYVTYMSDVTDIIKEKKSLQEFLNLLPTGVGTYRVYLDGRYEQIYLNDGFFQMLGIKRDNPYIKPGFSDLKHVYPKDVSKIKDSITNVLENKSKTVNVEYRVLVGENKYKRILLRGILIKETKEYKTFNCSFIEMDD